MPVESKILIVVAIINFVFASVITARNYRSRVHLLFAVTIFFNVLWAIGDAVMIGASSLGVAQSWSRLFFIAPMLTAYYLIVFAYSFPDNKKLAKAITLSLFVPVVALGAMILISSEFLVSDMFKGASINEFTPNSVNFLVYCLFFVVYFTVAYVIFYNKSRKTTGLARVQLNYVLLGVFGSSSLALLTNLLMPYVGNSGYVWLGPVFTLFYVAVSSYAIAKHQLFDIRSAIARSTAYALSLGTMLIIYVVLIFGATGLFLDDTTTIDNTQKFIYAVFAVLIAFTFQPLKNFFDKLTDKIFYRERYDPEVLLSDYTDFLVDETETDDVISVTLALMQEIANPSKSLIVLYRDGVAMWYEQSGQVYGDERDDLAKGLEYQSPSVYVATSSLRQKDAFLENIRKHMEVNDLQISVKLSTHGQLEGYILLGDKKSGSRYSQKDLNLFATIANELSVALQNSQRFDQIERFNVTLQKEVEEATARLKQTNQKLQQLDIAKDEFISMASHQLRTPLTSMKGYVSMVIDGDAGKINEDQKKLLSEAFSSSQRMVYLIADLLNVSRLKTGKFIIDRVKVDLAKMVQEEVYQLAPSATTRKVKITYVSPKSFPELMLDETKTRQVVMNFIDNAIYYTKAGGEVTVSLVAKKDKVEYRVKDTGIGIPAADQHKLFTKFFRAANARRARPDGTGLGLYMAQKIIAAQGGSITFKSKEKKGSTFGFNLPIKTPKDK